MNMLKHAVCVFTVLVLSMVNVHATNCIDDVYFDAGFGGCDTYGLDGSNHSYCSTDIDKKTGKFASVACPKACGKCSDPNIPNNFNDCDDDNSFDGGFGGCDTYGVGKSNHDYCIGDTDQKTGKPASQACAKSCGKCDEYEPVDPNKPYYPDDKPDYPDYPDDCKDDVSFNAGHGDCETYADGNSNHDYCMEDVDEKTGKLAVEACPKSCGKCGDFKPDYPDDKPDYPDDKPDYPDDKPDYPDYPDYPDDKPDYPDDKPDYPDYPDKEDKKDNEDYDRRN